MSSLLYSCLNLMPRKPPSTSLEAALAAESLTAEAAVPSGLHEPGNVDEGKEGKKDLWVQLQVVGAGEEYPTADGAAPELKSSVRTGRCCRKHEGSWWVCNISL